MAKTSDALKIIDRMTGDDQELRRMIGRETVIAGVVAALVRLLELDRDLLDSNVNERSISHKLAEHLQAEFPGWNVDCEYNRDGDKAAKRLHHLAVRRVRADDAKGTTVYPDIIIHKRGNKENLLVIEMKKSRSNTEAVKKDFQKLRAFKIQLYYQHTMFMVLDELVQCSVDDLDEKVEAMMNKAG